VSAPCLTIAELTVESARGVRPELDRFSLAVGAGETVVLLGEAGCGKEAVMRVLAGAPEPGETFAGTLQFGMADAERVSKPVKPPLRTVYLPSVSSHPLSPYASTVSQLVRIIARKLDVPRPAAREEFAHALERLTGAPPLAAFERKPPALSHEALAWGFFAAAFAQKPEFLLADHALSRLAPTQARMLARALLAEQQRQGFAMLYAAMNTEVAAWLGGRVVMMRHGRIVEEGPIARLSSAQAHAYTQTFFKAMTPTQSVPGAVRPTGRGQPVLQASGIEFTREKRPALTFELRRGAALALLGEDGSGRHALVNVLLGLDRPRAGRVVLDAVDVGILSETMKLRLRRRVAMIVGNDDVLDQRMTLWDTVAEPLRAHLKLPRDLVATYRDAALKRVGLASLPGDRTVSELSAFDKRRLQVARAIVSAPLLAVIDEPLRGLDAFAQSVMRDLLRNLRAQEGPAFIVITADVAAANALCDDAMVLQAGQVIERGPLAELIRAPKEAYTRALIEASLGSLSPAAPQG